MMTGSISILRRSLHVLKKTWITKFVMNFSQPLLYMTAMGLGVGAYISDMDGISYFKYVGTGTVAITALWEASFSCTYDVYVKMHYQKIYHPILAAPVTVSGIAWGEIWAAVFKSVLYAFAVFLAIVVLGFVNSWTAVVFLLPLALLALVVALLSLIFTAVNPSIEFFNYFTNLFIAPAYLFSGIFFPLETLPNWAQAIAWINPVYHGVSLSRGILLGNLPDFWVAHLGVLVIMAAFLSLWPTKLLYRKLIQ